jgi:hypothetical protein
MVGRLAVGYFGVTQVGAGSGGTDADEPLYAVVGSAPVIGVRYWISQTLGLDIGVGLGILGSDATAGDPEMDFDRGSFTGFNLHGGVPLALASADHFTFEIVPEVNLGIGSASFDPNGDADGDISMSGFHFDVGARAGAEIHFGFLKMPQLALQGSVGIALAIDNATTTDSTSGMDVEVKSSQTAFGTTVQGEPWDIFTGNIAALYYF